MKMYIRSLVKKLVKTIAEKTNHVFRVEIQLAHHCNLNCVGCSHFSPVAKEIFLDVNEYKNDCERLSQLASKYISEIHLMGGEPLLHKNISDIIEITRKNFPKTLIKVVSNGILLDKMEPDFWDACKKNNILISISTYPINLNIKRICELALQYDVTIDSHGSSYRVKFRKDVYNLEGTQDKKDSFKKCFKKKCPHLYEGKLYMCPSPAYIKHFNEYFSKELKVSDKDYIDIYQVKNVKTLLKFRKNPIPFCRYCIVDDKDTIPWHLSKKDISEWT